MKRINLIVTLVLMCLSTFALKAQAVDTVAQDTTTQDTEGVILDSIQRDFLHHLYYPDTLLVTNDEYSQSFYVDPDTGNIVDIEKIRYHLRDYLSNDIPSRYDDRYVQYIKPRMDSTDRRRGSYFNSNQLRVPFAFEIDYHLPHSKDNKKDDILVSVKYFFTYLAIRQYGN